MTADFPARFVEHVEHLLPAAAAAIFACDEDAVLVTRCAAGPRWRTAEQDPPAWLAPQSQALSQAVRAGSPLAGEVAFGTSGAGPTPVPELLQVPLVVAGRAWGALVVLRPAGSLRRALDAWIIEICARHLSEALTRLPRAAMPPRSSSTAR
jgi:hypothetical protein